MKYCGQCGNQLGTGRFCSRCGAPVPAETDRADHAVPPGPTSPPPSSRYPLYADQLPGPTTPPPSYPAPTAPPPSAPPPATPPATPPSAGRHARTAATERAVDLGKPSHVERAAVRPAQGDETAVRPSLQVVQDAASPQVPSLAETAIRPAVPRVDVAPRAPRHGHSAWAQTFWVLFVFLVVMTIAGLWLLL